MLEVRERLVVYAKKEGVTVVICNSIALILEMILLDWTAFMMCGLKVRFWQIALHLQTRDQGYFQLDGCLSM